MRCAFSGELFRCNYALLPGSSQVDGKESACNAGDPGSIPGREVPLEKGLATHSSVPAWRIPMNRGARWATVHGVSELDTTE